MSTTTQAIELIDELVKAKIPKQTATKLVDYADKQKGDTATKQDIEAVKQSVSIQKWAVGILAAGMFAVFGMLWQLTQTVATKQEVKEVKAEVNRRLEKIEAEQKENRKLLLQIIQNQKR